MKVLRLVFIVAALTAYLASAAIQRFEGSLAPRRTMEIGPSDHKTQKEIINSLHDQRMKRQSSSPPVQSGKYEFLDGYNYGRIHYSGSNSDVIFVLTYNLDRNSNPMATNLYRSVDYGKTFTNIESQLNPLDSDPLLWYSFYVSPVNLNQMVFSDAIESRIYITRNEGTTWDLRNFNPPTIDPRSIKFSPKVNDWILAHDPTNEQIYVSTDLGVTWKKVSDNVDRSSDYQWDELGWDSDETRIYFNQFDPNERDRGNYTVSLYTQRYPYDPENQEVFDPNLGLHEAFLIVGPYIFVQKTDSNLDAHLLVSYKRQPFKNALIPTPYDHRNYYVTHLEERQALVIVEHEGGFFNLYLSDETGAYYSLSLRDLVVEYAIDLELIDGVNGTMIANQYLRETPDISDAPKRTLLTLDNGGNWELIRPPDVDVKGNTVNCEPPLCSLHFHMDTSEYARLGVFSTDSAPGIIIAHGSLGDTLSDDPDLYISRDGGVTWHETLEGSYGVNVLDHGGILVAVNDYHQDQSRTLKYSCDEGISWTDFDFSDADMIVFGVITEPGQHTTNLSLYGFEDGGGRHWVVVSVDFDTIFTRDCESDDYYGWLPWDDRSDTNCILGSSIVIERRKIAMCCHNGQDYIRETQYTICECNEEDFECDYGYAKPGEDLTGLCVRDFDVKLDDPCVDKNATTYMASTGYRKVAGDVCEGGDEDRYAPYEAECCKSGTETPTTNETSNTSTHETPSSNPTTASPLNSKDSGSNSVALAAGLGVAVVITTGALIAVVIIAILFAKLKKQNDQLTSSGRHTYTTTINAHHDTQSEGEEDDDPLIP